MSVITSSAVCHALDIQGGQELTVMKTSMNVWAHRTVVVTLTVKISMDQPSVTVIVGTTWWTTSVHVSIETYIIIIIITVMLISDNKCRRKRTKEEMYREALWNAEKARALGSGHLRSSLHRDQMHFVVRGIHLDGVAPWLTCLNTDVSVFVATLPLLLFCLFQSCGSLY